ncbi:hypothetical protein [Moraxella caviae]|uniref:hypothetical protein n=1 Tax=Moraxella caviae TaxID=34060 RepID=UPI00155A00E8|nr:hypothetical protein [Moraxella caviae]
MIQPNNSVDKSHTNTNQTAASCGALDDCDVFDGISANHLYVILWITPFLVA